MTAAGPRVELRTILGGRVECTVREPTGARIAVGSVELGWLELLEQAGAAVTIATELRP